MPEMAALTADFKYRLLLDISQRISRTFDLHEVLSRLLESLRGVLPFDAAGIFVLQGQVPLSRETGFVIAGMATVGFSPQPRPDDEMRRFGRGIIGHVIASGEPVVAPDVRLDPHYVEGRASTLSEIAVPIFSGDHVIGALNLERDTLHAYSASDVELLQFFATVATLSIEKAILHREVIETQRIAQQLKLAAEVQANLLPAAPPPLPGYDIAARNVPTWEIGGDYYDYVPLADGRLGLVVADVAGKGVAAALIMASFRAALRAELRRETDIVRIAGDLDEMVRESTDVSRFVTAIYAVLQPATGEVTYVNCGHNPPVLVGRDGGRTLLHPGGPALGLPGHARYVSGCVRLLPGDMLALYTDAVVEVTDPDDREFGVDRLVEVLAGHAVRPSDEAIRAVVETTQAFAGRGTYDDDFTLVVVRRLQQEPDPGRFSPAPPAGL